MRSVFTSPRLENVEAVAKLLEDAGIEVRISNDRSYKGARRRPFSYRDSAASNESNPQVWIIKAEDQPKARQILREQGLIDSTRPDMGHAQSYIPPSRVEPDARKPDRRAAIVMRVRFVLLVSLVVLTVLTLSGILHR